MINLAKNLIKFRISVYDGISPALLATISLGQNIKGKNHQQLVNSLKTSNIVQSNHILSALKQLDRSIFTHQQKVYENKPYKISKGQCMTDIFSHAIILSNIQPHLKSINKKRLTVLDIGTGHGYLAFCLWSLSQKLQIKQALVTGIDCYDQCISKCQELKANLGIKSDLLKFQKQDINQLIKNQTKWDVIVGGFFIQPSLSKKLQNMLQKDGIGIWPQVSQSGQGLYVTKKGKNKQYIMETLFSQQVVQSSVEQYFLTDPGQLQQSQQNIEKNEAQRQQQQRQNLQRLKIQRNEKKKFLQQKLKQLIQQQKTKLSIKSMTLKQMQKVPEINSVLEQLKRYK